MNIKRYSELIKFLTFEERYDYLKLNGRVGEDTFGFDRYLNQVFYRSKEWRSVRDFVIARDNGCDLAIDGREIFDKILIHHMNPITKDDVLKRRDYILDPEYLITVTKRTHDAIHYSMVVIDAGKHKLDYKQSEIDNNIKALRKEYQVKFFNDGYDKYSVEKSSSVNSLS